MKSCPDQNSRPMRHFFKVAMVLCWPGMLGVACLSQPPPQTPIAPSNFCAGVCNPIQVIVQEKETALRVTDASVVVTRWEGNTWRRVLECENDQTASESEARIAEDQGCFLMNVAGLYQFTAVAAGYDILEQRLKLGRVETVDDFFDCSCSPESTLNLNMQLRREASE